MCYRKRLLALSVTIALMTFVLPSTPAKGFNLGDLNPFAQKRLGRITGSIKPPSISTSLKKMNSGTQKILSGTKEILFPWAGPKRTKLPPPPPPTGTRRVYPADARPNS